MRAPIALPAFLFAILFTGCSRHDLHFAGRVVDPHTGKGIAGVYVAAQGMHADPLMGSPIYYDDLIVDSTDRQGDFHITVPAKTVDSFLKEHGGPFGTWQMVLTTRVGPSNASEIHPPFESTFFWRLQDVDSPLNFYDQNFIDHRIRYLGDKKKLPGDLTGLSIPLYRSGGIRLKVPDDSIYLRDHALYVAVTGPAAKGGTQLRSDYSYLDQHAIRHPLIFPANKPLDLVFCKWNRTTHAQDTLLVKTGLVLKPGEMVDLTLP